MTTRPIMLNLPDFLYEQIQQRAAEKQHSIETELLEVVAAAVPIEDQISPDILQAVSTLAVLNDKTLEKIAANPLAKRKGTKISSLHLKRQREGLDERDTRTLADLMAEYDKAVLMRANSIEILRQRGHDISKFFTLPQR